VRTLAAVLALSGRAGRTRLGGKIDAGFEAPGRARLELPAPGRPYFTFVANGNEATLVLPRDKRVLRGAPPEATLEALAGVSLGPDELRSIVAGCGYGAGAPASGREFPGGWAAIDVGGTTNWIQQIDGTWRLVAALRGPIEVRYGDFQSGRPLTIRLLSTPGQTGPAVNVTIRPSQVDINQPLGPEVFQVEVPADATPLTLDELRQAGPLGR
jgi:hypothetical protein